MFYQKLATVMHKSSFNASGKAGISERQTWFANIFYSAFIQFTDVIMKMKRILIVTLLSSSKQLLSVVYKSVYWFSNIF